ncbi:LysM peptidoglycan-binding domain-containing protein [Curtobacterium sp. MCLR17_007]|uniref:LysM peptidoglycan-binding domain-containing protein n=1 Tax=Curtobacterium sp. MCLR17_007 TaxID=2175648 RepID=UPI0021ACD201|nr:LysM peptidoglycan-binding domain-containing protein [Curtobacterium sp. MCLR17_007]WIB61537.1 LysM peptidoglycan-binding domain-containing protein [Curtobacterium sp. MCLR17_007]
MDTAADDHARRQRSARFATMPIVLAGTIAVTAGLTGPVAHAEPRHDDDGNAKRHVDEDHNVGHRSVYSPAVARPAQTVATTVSAVRGAPTTYTVQQGDTVSGIAARFGLSAQEVLVRNGLGWNTIIHPGQTLHLASAPAVATVSTASSTSSTYHVKQGDTISGIAARVGVSTSALLGANALSLGSVIFPGQTLTVPKAGAAPRAAAPAAPARTAPAASAAKAGSVTITAGQTIATIAAAHGVSVSALLSANGLTYTSTIYAGKTLVLPTAGAAPTASGTALTAEQRANAETIVRVGRSLGVPQRGLVVALSAAMQESSLRNLPHGDRDSVGLFQQRPSQGWGTAAQLQDPTYAARLFFGGRSNPNAGTTRGLLDVSDWSTKSVTDAAQAVQMSAYPKAYAQWEQAATAWLATL